MRLGERDDRATRFLPAERCPQDQIKCQHELVKVLPLVTSCLDATHGLVAVLNENRQIIFLNDAFRKFLNREDLRFGLGLRIGEMLNCSHAGQGPNGCGTTEACTVCGVALAMASVINDKTGTATNECRIESARTGKDFNLTTSVTGLRALGMDLMVFAAVDITADKRRQALERIIFRDQDARPPENSREHGASQYAPLAAVAAGTLMEEITSQRELLAAEHGELEVRPSWIDSGDLLNSLARIFSNHPLGRNKTITCADADSIAFTSDRRILFRVLGNLIKNALEAEKPGAAITLSCRRRGEMVAFVVQNPTPMPRDVQLQIFQKSFTTKGEGRGLGTYSVRLLSERYLKGRVECISDPTCGTWFIAEYPRAYSAA